MALPLEVGNDPDAADHTSYPHTVKPLHATRSKPNELRRKPYPALVVRQIFAQLNDHDAETLPTFLSDDVVEVWPLVGRLEGSPAIRDHFAAIFAAMPDFRIDAERIAADGETVFVHWHATGTFTGTPFLRIHATGRPIDLRGSDCFTVRDQKVAANFVAYDAMTFAFQAGIVPPHGSRTDHAMTLAINGLTRVKRWLGR